MDRILRILNANEVLRENINEFKKAFIEYYGENSRAEVEDKFSKMLPIGYTSPDLIENILYTIENNYTDNVLNHILEDRNISLNKEDLNNNSSFKYLSLQPIYNYKKFYEAFTLGTEERKKQFYENGYKIVNSYIKISEKEFYQAISEKKIPEKYQNIPEIYKETFAYFIDEKNAEKEYQKLFTNAEELLKKIIPEITISNFPDYLTDERLQELNKILEEYDKALEEFNSLKEALKPYYDKEELIIDTKSSLQKKYYQKFLSENIALIPADKRTNLEEYINGKIKEYELDEYTRYFFANSLFSIFPLESFTSESENILYEGTDWKKQEIMQTRIEYFQKNGIDLGDDYELYLKDSSAQKIWPSTELADTFVASKNKYLNDFNNEFYTSLPDHQHIRQEIDKLNLLDKADSFNATLYLTKGSLVSPNIRKRNNIIELFSLLIIYIDNYDDRTIHFTDHYVAHELNHIFELCLGLVGENEYEIICGWDVLTSEIKSEIEPVDTINQEEEKRPYELFNEIINELIAQDISKIMHKKNIFIFDNPKQSKYNNSTSYEHSLFLVKEFFNEFKDKIIASRRNGQIHIILDEVGKENFDELNSLFEIYFENFSGFKIYNLLSDLKDNKDTEQTRIYNDLVARKDKILEKMRTHQANKKEENYESQVTI